MQEKEVLTTAELAEMFRVHKYRVHELVRQDILPHFRLGRQIRFPASAIRAFMEAGGKALPGGWRRSSDR